MKMGLDYNCYGCKREFSDEVRLRKIVTNDDGKYERYCRDCITGTAKSSPDVWYGYGSGTHTEENICDPETGKPIPFSSKRGKWEAMQKAGVREAGDRVHGARTTFTK